MRFLREGRSREGQEADESAGDGGDGEMEALGGGHSDDERRFDEGRIREGRLSLSLKGERSSPDEALEGGSDPLCGGAVKEEIDDEAEAGSTGEGDLEADISNS